jgi:Ankyrin repeats (3 copies)/Ankyrin repeats (many copies)
MVTRGQTRGIASNILADRLRRLVADSLFTRRTPPVVTAPNTALPRPRSSSSRSWPLVGQGTSSAPADELGEGLGVPRAAVDMLIGKATSLDLPLPQAVMSDRVEFVRLLLDVGADPGTRTDGTTPLEKAIGAGNTQVVDLLAEYGIVPAALWTYAACGRLDLVRACFDADGGLRPDAALSRPNPANFFPVPPRIPATSDPEEIMAEAFVHACQHGRTEVVRWFLDRGLNPDIAPYFGRTGLLWAIIHQQVEVVRLLMERGADPSIHDEFVPFGAAGLLGILSAVDGRDPVVRQLRKLIKSRSR